MRDKKSKRFGKAKKGLLGLITLMIIILMVSQNNVSNVKCADNYSNYLYNQPIHVFDDKAMILNEISDSGNNYRNYFDSDFLFPSKLSNEMFNAYTTDYSQYSFSQTYLNNLDNDFAFKNNDNSENIETNKNINIPQNEILNGTRIDNNIEYNQFNCNPNQAIDVSWGYSLYPNHYSNILGYPRSSGEYIRATQPNLLEQFGFENTDIEIFTIYTIEVKLRSKYVISGNNDFRIQLYNNSEYSNIEIRTQESFPTINNIKFNFTNQELSQNDINNISLKMWSPSVISSGYMDIYSLQLTLYGVHNYSYIKSVASEGTSGHFPAEYSFENDADDSIPIGWTLSGTGTFKVLSDFQEHTKIVEYHDTTSGGFPTVKTTFSSQTSGIFEFWFAVDESSAFCGGIVSEDSGSDIAIYIMFKDGLIKYYDGSEHSLRAYTINTWYHIKLVFDCSPDTYDIYIDGVLEQSNADFLENTDSLINFKFAGSSSPEYYNYLDALDFSWSDGYYDNRNRYDIGNFVNIEKEMDIEYITDTSYRPVFLYIKTEYCSNLSVDLFLDIYNYDMLFYSSVLYNKDENEFNEYTFQFNESGQYRLNKFKIRIYSENFSNSFNFYIKNISLNIIYTLENSFGYQALSITYNKQNDATEYQGYSMIEFKIYKNYTEYKYSEINEFTDNFQTSWIRYNYVVNISTFEINAHCRYGLNTLDIEITNIKFELYINSQLAITFNQQDRKAYTGNHYQTYFNYSSNNRNYLNLTGIIGNYSYNTLKGIRCLSGSNDLNYDRYFDIPLFSYDIDVSQRKVIQGTFGVDDEPDSPKGASYWTYQTYRIVQGSSFETEVGNWSVEYTTIDAELYTAKYYYNKESIKSSKLGSWTFKIGDWKISFKFIRNTIAFILNLILLFFQYLFYLVVASLSFIFMFLGCYICVVLFNIVLYYLYIGICYVGWFIILGLGYIWSFIVWIYTTFLIPFLKWLRYTLLPLILDWTISYFAFALTCLVWCLTLGQIDFWSTYTFIYDTVWLIVRELYQWIITFFNNIIYLLLFALWYIICIIYLYGRYLVARARGFDIKAKKYLYTLTFFFTPFQIIIDWIKGLMDITPVV
jgi:hypothetical protein